MTDPQRREHISDSTSQVDTNGSRPITGERRRRVERPLQLEVVREADSAEIRADLDFAWATTEEEAAPLVNPRERSELLNRAVNVLLAIVALVIVAPIMLLTALVIKLTSPGPVLYTQTRVGVDRRASRTRALYDRRERNVGGVTFTILKFRTMQVDAERHTGPVWASPDDPRITPLGRFLRKTRIDELPQLFNVIRGDMNIVGPRPERPSIFARLRTDIAEYPLRQRAKPGITGWAQINHSYDRNVDDVREKVRYDLEYLQRQGLVEDIRIMLRTVPVMLFRKGGW